MDQQQREQLRDIVTGLAKIEGSSDAALIQLGHGACTVMGPVTRHSVSKPSGVSAQCQSCPIG